MKQLVCLECQVEIKDFEEAHPCPSCKFPLCSPKLFPLSMDSLIIAKIKHSNKGIMLWPNHLCNDTLLALIICLIDFQGENGENHRDECQVFAGCSTKPSSKGLDLTYLLTCLPLRTLFKMDTQPEVWARLDLLMDHVQDMSPEDRRRWEDRVVNFILNDCNYKRFSSAQIMRAIGIFLTNGVNQGFMKGHALYDNFSLVSHSCVNNSRFQVRPDRCLVLRAQTEIEKDSEITAKYMPTLLGNSRRRPKLKNTWHFECQCPRCNDFSECGSMIDAIVCRQCKERRDRISYMVQRGFEQDFECLVCLKRVSCETALVLFETLEEEHWSALRSGSPSCISALVEQWQQHALHPNHSILLRLKMGLIEMLCKQKCTVDELQSVVKMGQEVIGVMECIEPGLSLNRGRVLRQMHPCRLQLLAHQKRSNQINCEEFKQAMKKVIEDMRIAVMCLEDFSKENISSDK